MSDDPESGARRGDLSALKISDEARSERSGTGRTVLAVAVFALLLAVVAVVWVAQGRAAEVQVASVRTAAAGEGATLLNASGYVTPRRRATIAAKITARVVEMLADEGMRVEAGQVLARLDDADASRRLVTAGAGRDAAAAAVPVLEVNLANAERELTRQQGLENEGVASVQALDLARTSRDALKAQLVEAHEQIRVAEANLASARQDVENCTVRAPFAGIVVSKDAQEGEMVSPISAGSGYTRTGIATVVDMDSIEVEVDVNESYIAKVTSGQRVEATLDAYPDWHMPAHVRTVIPTADRQKATVKVRISFEKLDPRILPDMGVKVAFLAESQPSGLRATPQVVVPAGAVRDEGETKVVFLVRDGKVERRAVRIGASRGTDVEVLAGLGEGDQVVVAGPEGLHDGQRVKVK